MVLSMPRRFAEGGIYDREGSEGGKRSDCRLSLDENYALFDSKCRRISNLVYITASIAMIPREGFDTSGLKILVSW
jgi:hypothetical protein